MPKCKNCPGMLVSPSHFMEYPDHEPETGADSPGGRKIIEDRQRKLTGDNISWPFRDAPRKSDNTVDYADHIYSVGICQNCGDELTYASIWHGTLFCSEKCQQVAKAVRYGRSHTRDGRYESDPTVREALDIKIVTALGGGYPEKERRLTPEQREYIFTRDGWICQICKVAPATEVDHIDGSSSDPDNLQAVCRTCNLAKAKSSPTPASIATIMEAHAIFDRIRSEQPVVACDNERVWDKLRRKISSEQKAQVRSKNP